MKLNWFRFVKFIKRNMGNMNRQLVNLYYIMDIISLFLLVIYLNVYLMCCDYGEEDLDG